MKKSFIIAAVISCCLLANTQSFGETNETLTEDTVTTTSVEPEENYTPTNDKEELKQFILDILPQTEKAIEAETDAAKIKAETKVKEIETTTEEKVETIVPDGKEIETKTETKIQETIENNESSVEAVERTIIEAEKKVEEKGKIIEETTEKAIVEITEKAVEKKEETVKEVTEAVVDVVETTIEEKGNAIEKVTETVVDVTEKTIDETGKTIEETVVEEVIVNPEETKIDEKVIPEEIKHAKRISRFDIPKPVKTYNLSEDMIGMTIVKETNTAAIVFNGKKYGIVNKETNAYLVQPIIDSICELASDEYKISVLNLIGYVNTKTNMNFLTNYDNISLVGNYIKTVNNKRYGLMDKQGIVVLRPIFQSINVVNRNNEEFIYGKLNGVERIFQNTGRLIQGNEVFLGEETVGKIEKVNNVGERIYVQDVKSEYIKQRHTNSIVYEQRKEVPNPGSQLVYILQEIDNPKAKSEKPDKIVKKNDSVVTIGTKNYILTTNRDKVGLLDENRKEILPAIYENINIKEISNNSSDRVILAKYKDSYSIFNLKGKSIGEITGSGLNIYLHNKIYKYTYENTRWVLRENGRILGHLTKDGNNFKFKQKKFSIYDLNKINEILIALLTIA